MKQRLNVWKIVAIAFMVGTVVTTAHRMASAQGGGPCNNQPNMAAALVELHNAREWLERASNNKGGWRVGAIEWTENAIRATDRGCAFADTH
jgi:hypothetical protein